MSGSAQALRLGGMGVILFAAFVRAMTNEVGTPFWDVDPLAAALPETTLLPAYGFLLDALVWLGAGAAVIGEVLAGRGVMWRSGGLVLVGVVGVVLHGLVLVPSGADGVRGEFNSLVTGSAWAAAMIGAWAIVHLGRDPAVRQSAGMALLGLVVLLACVGVYEYFFEHARTVADFDADPERALMAYGIEPGSPGARVFERRLRQPEATGWFALANVYGSFAAAGFIGWLGVAVACVIRRRWRVGAVSAVVGVACLGGLVMSGSKGAFGAAGIVGVVGLVSMVPRLRGALGRVGPVLAIGAAGLPLVVVVVRGIIGERVGELSMLFRWHYAVAAGRIFAEHPIEGVGSGGFKAAYELAKVPRNPESVDSAHSILLDWGATLGLFGLAWGVVFFVWVWWIGRGLGRSELQDEGSCDGRSARGACVLAILTAVLVAWRLDELVDPDEMLVRVLGVCAWIGVLYLRLPALRFALAGAGLVMAVHMQLEMTGVRTTSVLPAMLLLGLGAALPSPTYDLTPEAPSRRSMLLGSGTGALSCVMAGVLVIAGVVPAWRWQGQLKEAAALLYPSEERGVSLGALDAAVAHLRRADTIVPSRTEPLEHAARLRMIQASVLRQNRSLVGARGNADEAIEFAQLAADRFPRRAKSWSKLAGVHRGRFELLGERQDLEAAEQAWASASGLDPQALTPAYRAWELNMLLAQTDRASEWARRVLELDEQLELDPLMRLPASERDTVERSAIEGGETSESSAAGGSPQHE